MKLKHFLTLVTAIALIFTVGCDDKEKQTNTAASFQLDQTELDFTCDGGQATVNYTITNPVQGGVVLTNCTASWVKDLSTATYGSIKFTVAPNYTNAAREATITVEYTGVEGKHSIAVRQAASEAPVFSYDVTYTDTRTILLDVIPADKETAFICDIYSVDYIESFGLSGDLSLFNYHMQSLSYKADRASQSFLNYLHNISYSGDTLNIEFTDLNPDTEYVVFSYHIDLANATLIGDIYREVIRSGKPAQIDTTFDMELSVKNITISQTINASNEETYYYTGYWKTSDFYSYFGPYAEMEEVFPAKWNETVIVQQSYGKTVEQILAEFCKQDSQTIEVSGLEQYTDYAFYIFAVDPTTGFAASEPIIATATTTSVNHSDVTITIWAENIFATTADVYWKASSKSAKFCRSVFTKDEFEALGADDNERFASIKANDYWFYEATGDTDMNLYNLTPNTTYVAFAYGIDGESPNTGIFTYEFKTSGNAAGSSNISISVDKHYNIDEVAAIDAAHWGEYADYTNSALATATISNVKSSDTVYIMATTFPLDYYTDDDQWLRDVAKEQYKVNCYSSYNFIFEYEREYSIIAVAKDSNGNYGKVFKESVILYRSDAADVASYVYVENK